MAIVSYCRNCFKQGHDATNCELRNTVETEEATSEEHTQELAQELMALEERKCKEVEAQLPPMPAGSIFDAPPPYEQALGTVTGAFVGEWVPPVCPTFAPQPEGSITPPNRGLAQQISAEMHALTKHLSAQQDKA